MDTYTALKSLGGILGLITFVALLTFYEDMLKWVQRLIKQTRRNFRKSRNRSYRLANAAKRQQPNYKHYHEPEDSLFLKPSDFIKPAAKINRLSEPALEDHQEVA